MSPTTIVSLVVSLVSSSYRHWSPSLVSNLADMTETVIGIARQINGHVLSSGGGVSTTACAWLASPATTAPGSGCMTPSNLSPSDTLPYKILQ
ncbi:hypothetical protein P153DRAFT_47852 [Dothidotthia symphoricarpi CBS 119687]|uniref:Uncharacterized protein n=1 Tax=Dothidotthia symphoricarpi CBS 119687 TaxID=1392245 RepID=A0A6A6A894_9PLEO|nr:uncharacterized protein P153DRAFT_47852 [Dothidotthia symphoricarpi CBS 119687]KAF2128079.1 hypothetical protein P153DRAFT_47852 [Dothidotthia symphoricarpi CBS 119687]